MARGAARIKKREATWRRVVAGYSGSGLSIRAYCAKCRVKEPAFYWWRAKLTRRNIVAKDAATLKAAFVPVVVKAPVVAGTEGVSIELRGGRVLRLPAMAVERIAELVRAIEGAA